MFLLSYWPSVSYDSLQGETKLIAPVSTPIISFAGSKLAFQSIECQTYRTDFFCPSYLPSEWLKNIFWRWLKMNCINRFNCWNSTHLLRQETGLFLTKIGEVHHKMCEHCMPKVWCFFLFYKIQIDCCFYIPAHTEATEMIFVLGHRWYPPICFLIQNSLCQIHGWQDISWIVMSEFSKM